MWQQKKTRRETLFHLPLFAPGAVVKGDFDKSAICAKQIFSHSTSENFHCSTLHSFSFFLSFQSPWKTTENFLHPKALELGGESWMGRKKSQNLSISKPLVHEFFTLLIALCWRTQTFPTDNLKIVTRSRDFSRALSGRKNTWKYFSSLLRKSWKSAHVTLDKQKKRKKLLLVHICVSLFMLKNWWTGEERERERAFRD